MGRHLRLIKKLNKIIKTSSDLNIKRAAENIYELYTQRKITLSEAEEWYDILNDRIKSGTFYNY